MVMVRSTGEIVKMTVVEPGPLFGERAAFTLIVQVPAAVKEMFAIPDSIVQPVVPAFSTS